MANLDSQIDALVQRCGVWRSPPFSALSLTGADRMRLLNGLTTCDVARLPEGRGLQGFITDVKGHILAEVVVRARPSSLLLQLPTGKAEEIGGHIEKYVVADRVDVEPATERPRMALIGPAAGEALAELSAGLSVNLEAWAHVEGELDGHRLLVADDRHFGVPGYLLWCGDDMAGRLTERLLEGESRIAVAVDGAAVDRVRIEAGVPWFGTDYDSRHLPQESGLESAVDYEKGCYLGQEVVARLHYRGQVARRITRLEGEMDAVVEVGGELYFEGRSAGAVTSVAASASGETKHVLAMLQRRAFAPGSELSLANGVRLRVVD